MREEEESLQVVVQRQLLDTHLWPVHLISGEDEEQQPQPQPPRASPQTTVSTDNESNRKGLS